MSSIKDIFFVSIYLILLLIGLAICLPLLGFVFALYLLVIAILFTIPYTPYLIGLGILYFIIDKCV